MSRTPARSRVQVNGIEIAVWEWPGDGPPILFCHAASFHGRIWDQVVEHLPGRRSIAFDARGHGGSSKPAPPYRWRDFGYDVAALTDALRLQGALGVGHSFGGHAVTLAAALKPSAFSSLVLLDPVIRPRHEYVGPWTEAGFVTRRRNRWTSATEMFENFSGRPPFNTWDREVLRDYCEYGLTPGADGFTLACSPEVEASIYEESPQVETDIYGEIEAVRIPVRVVRAGRLFDPANFMGTSPTAPDLAATFAHGTDICLAEYSHFIPMEAPALVAKMIADALALL